MTSEQPAPAPPAAGHRSSRSVGDMIRTLALVGVLVLAIVVVNYRAPEDPVRPIDPAPTAAQVAAVTPFDVLLPTDPGWSATAARWEPTPASQSAEVWYVGGVYSAEGPFAGLTQSTAESAAFLAEQTGNGDPVGTAQIAGAQWQRYQSPDGERSLVLVGDGQTTVVTGTGSWEDLQRFAESLRPVGRG